MKIKKFGMLNIPFFLLMLVCCFQIMPIFIGYFRTYTEVVVYALFMISIGRIGRKSLKRILVVSVVSILFFIFIAMLMHYGIGYGFIEVIRNYIGILVAMYIVDSLSAEKNDKLLKFMVLIITITEITSLIVSMIYPQAARLMATGVDEYIQYYYPNINFYKYNLAGFAFASVLPVVLCVLHALMKQGRIKKSFFIFQVVLQCLCLIRLEFTLAIIVYAITLVFVWLKVSNIKKIVIFAFGAALLLVIGQALIKQLLLFMATHISSENIATRVNELYLYLTAGAARGDLSGRFDRYIKSIDYFKSNIIIGTLFDGTQNGGHSAILDVLAGGGICALLYMLFTFKKIYRYTIYPYRKYSWFKYIAIGQIAFFMMAFLNPIFWGEQLFISLVLSTCGCKAMSEHENHVMKE